MNDLQIVERILNRREKNLFAVVVAKYSALVYSKALVILRDEELAKDVSQQAFIKAYTNLIRGTAANRLRRGCRLLHRIWL